MSPHPTRLPAYLRPLLEEHPSYLARGVRRRDVAYACYLYFGAMLAIAFILNWAPTGSLLYGVVADSFGAAVLFGFIPAALVGVGNTLYLRRDLPLVVLAVATLGVPVVLRLAEWPSVGDLIGSVYFGAFTLLALVLPLRWFLVLRRRLGPPGS